MSNLQNLMNDFTNQEEKKSIYKSYREGISIENAFDSMDTHNERVCMACKSSCVKKQQANQRLDERTQKCQSPPDGYIFDR